jgi:hypothetical protein
MYEKSWPPPRTVLRVRADVALTLVSITRPHETAGRVDSDIMFVRSKWSDQSSPVLQCRKKEKKTVKAARLDLGTPFFLKDLV